MGRAKLKLRAAQRYVPAAAQVETDRAERRASTVEFVPLELPQEPAGERRQAAVAAPPKKTKPCLVEAPTPSECWSQPPVADAESKREAVEGKEEVVQLDGDALGRDDSAQCVYCLPRVTLRRPDGVTVDVMAAALAGGGPAGAEASLHLGGGRKAIDPQHPVLYMNVHGGRMRLEGRLVTTRSAHIATLSVSKGVKGEEREVRLRDRLPGVVVFHQLEWLGSVDDNPKDEARAFPDSIEVENNLPGTSPSSRGNASDTKETVTKVSAAWSVRLRSVSAPVPIAADAVVAGVVKGANAFNIKTKARTATVDSDGEQLSLETSAQAEEDFARDETAPTRLLSPSKAAAETMMSPPQDAAHVLGRDAPATSPLRSSEHNGQREKAETQPTSVDEPLGEWAFSQSDAVGSESESCSSRNPSPARTRRTGKRRHKFGTNDSDEDPDWTESVDPTSAVESEVESESSSSASRSSTSAELPMPKAKRRKRRREDTPLPSTEKEAAPRPSTMPMPSAFANNTSAAKRRREPRPHTPNDDEIIVLDDDSDDESDEDDEDDEDDEARHQPRKDRRRGVASAPSESDGSIELVRVVEAPVVNRTPSRPTSQGKGGRGAFQWFAKPKALTESEGDEDDDEAIARPRRRAARKRPRVLDSDEEQQQEDQRSSGGGGGSDDDDDDELVNQVLNTPRRAIG